ncbi:MAG: hypothetical protein IKQ39_03375 [Oscillospiraceae bacterium]|nr:hypothetical protein [Oscillospiraceae bacterium]
MPQKEMPRKERPQKERPKQSGSSDDSELIERRKAISQARAIRRGAAAMDGSAKAKAAKSADSIMKKAKPAPPRKPAHKQAAPKAVTEGTGKYGWLGEKEAKKRPRRNTEQELDRILADTAPHAGRERGSAGKPARPVSERPVHSGDAPRRYTQRHRQMTEAEAKDQYQRTARDARPALKKMTRKTDKAWKKEAAEVQAKRKCERAAFKIARINVLVCLTMLFGIALGMLLLERPTVSMEENRTLAKMPSFSVDSYLSGEYTNGVAEYYNDTVPFRSTFKDITQRFRKHFGMSNGPVIIGGMPAIMKEPEKTAEQSETEPVTTTTAPSDDPEIEVTTTKASATTPAEPQDDADDEPAQGAEMGNNGILIADKRGIMMFGGWESMGQGYADALNRFQAALPDVKMYNMVVPTVCSFYTPDEFKDKIASEKANIDYINNHLEGVIPVDCYSALELHKDEEIYRRTDHHWGALGAFYAAEKFSSVARVPFARIEEYERHTKEGYVGTLYSYSNSIIIKENPEVFDWYVPKTEFKTTYYTRNLTNPFVGGYFINIDNSAPIGWYCIYMGGDDHIVHVETEVNNGRKLAVIKDSYGNALIPWLTSSFEDIYVLDMRYFKINAIDYLRQEGVTDVLFCMNSFSANNGDNWAHIDDMRTQ